MKRLDISKTDAPRVMPYAKLRGALKEINYTQDDLARYLQRSRAYITNAMTSKTAWSMPDCYKVLKLIKQPAAMLHEYFPEGGYAKAHPEEAADRALFKKASVSKRFGGGEKQEDLLREGCNMVSPAPQCALRLADLLFNRGDYDEALNFLKQCILAIQKPQPDVNPSYVYLLYAMIRTSKLIAETSAGDYSSKEAETYGIYKDFHTALDKSYISTTYEEAVKRTIRVLELQTGFKDTTPASNNEEFI